MSSTPDKDGLNEALQSLVRGSAAKLDAYILEITPATSILGTKTTVRSYHLALNSSGQARLRDFARAIARRVIDFAIPRHKVDAAKEQDMKHGGTDHVEALSQEAHALFTSVPSSGEGGEVLLSTLVEFLLGYPQLFTKMSLKTNRQVHAHGADGIHATLGESGALALCWGESKLHANYYSAIDECLKTIAPFLLDEGGTGSRRERDLVLLRDGLNLKDERIVEALKRFLNPDDVLFRELEHRGVCLVGYDSPDYNLDASSNANLSLALCKSVERVKARIESQVLANKLQSTWIDVFHIPFPAVEEFRKAFRSEMRL